MGSGTVGGKGAGVTVNGWRTVNVGVGGCHGGWTCSGSGSGFGVAKGKGGGGGDLYTPVAGVKLKAEEGVGARELG